MRSMRESRIEAVTSTPAMKTRPALVEAHRLRLGELGEAVGLVERHAALHGEPRERPVHGAGIEVAEAQALGEQAGNRALSGSRRPVDGNDHRVVTALSSSKNPGKLIATASAPLTSTPSRDTTPAIAPSMARRWSPAESIVPPRGRAGDASDAEAVVARLDPDADVSERRRHGFDAIRLLDPELARAAHLARPACAGGQEREERQLVDEARHLGRSNPRRRQRRGAHLEIGDRLAALLATVEHGDARAHPVEDVEQARAGRVHVHALDDQLRVGEQCRRDDEGRGRGEVAWYVDAERRQALDRPDGDRPGPSG